MTYTEENSQILPSPTERTLFRSRIAGLNQALGGGFRKGESTLVGGPTGGGKTILACQLGFELAASGAKVVLVTTETSPDHLMPRFIANATNTTIDRLKATTEEEYDVMLNSLFTDPRTKNAMAQLEYILEHNLWILDRSNDDYEPMSRRLASALQELQKKRITPDVVIYDWLGSTDSQGVRNSFELRRRYKESADGFAVFCRQNKLAGIIFCQLAPGLVGSKTTSIRSSMVAEAKNMIEHMANFIGITAIRGAGGTRARRQYLCIEPKNGRAQDVPVEQQFEYQRFAGVEGTL